MPQRIYNFSPGPWMLPEVVLESIKEDLLDWHGCGMSVLEMTHRGDEFGAILRGAERDLRDLLDVPADYHMLFLQGGGHLQFAMVPLNLLAATRTADYLCTGY